LRGRRNAWALGNDQLLFAFFFDDLFRITAEFFLFFEMDELVVVTGYFSLQSVALFAIVMAVAATGGLINVISHVCQAPPQPARLILHLGGTFWQWPPSEKKSARVRVLTGAHRPACVLPEAHSIRVLAPLLR
jgi:hypothetical protein